MSSNSASRFIFGPIRHLQSKVATRLFVRLLAGLKFGRITLILPSGQHLNHDGAEAGPNAVLELHNWRPLRRLLLRGDIGLAESYIDGDWDSADLSRLVEFAAVNIGIFDHRLTGFLPARLVLRLSHLLKGNSKRRSRKNISLHYDLGNKFYKPWLDRQMIYSSAIYADDRMSLERAQEHKVERIVELLQLSGSERVLEIGCGWGALATRVARGSAHVTGITLSREQHSYARESLGYQGLTNTPDIRLEDYRDVKGLFDRIVSIEMIEAVGEAYWPNYFDTLRRCLKERGRVVLQAITIRKDQFEKYRRRADFIQTYVFPGGMLPSEEGMVEQARRSGLTLVDSERFGRSYARTLAEWRDRFNQAWPEIRELGFTEKFRRLWNYYLCYCEGGFKAGTINVGLYVFKA